MTRARKKLFISYVMMDSHWQMLHASRFVQEIPSHLFEVQGGMNLIGNNVSPCNLQYETATADKATMGCNLQLNLEELGIVSRLLPQWAKTKAFQNAKRLLDKISFVIDERLRTTKGNGKVWTTHEEESYTVCEINEIQDK